MRRFVPPALALALALGSLSGCSDDGDTGRIRLGVVERGGVAETVEAPATLTAKANATLRSPADGTVAKLRVRDGDRVKEGQVLARIASPSAQEQLDQAEEADRQAADGVARPSGLSIAAFKDEIDKIAKRGFKKAREVAMTIEDPKERAKALAEITQAEGDYASAAGAAEAAVERLNAGIGGVTAALSSIGAASRVQTKAAVKAARRTVDGLVLRAPFAGVVSLGGPSGGSNDALAGLLPSQLAGLTGDLAVPGAATDGAAVAVGAPVTSGAAVVTVTDVSELRLTADIDESDVLKVERGRSADADFDALPEAVYTAKVYSVGVTPKAGTGGGVTYQVQLELAGGTLPDGAEAPEPKPGMSAVVRITVREVDDVLVIPVAAVVSSGRDSVVWVNDGGKAVRRVVKLGAEGDGRVEVVSGLGEGDAIVVSGADSVEAGQDLT
ncbi:efflux RND transporter periplasmic adaptor subunit [Actinocorallia sp. A-T 12471]|uniref:efflux RND transporter periplasmic adaptor subunit n=1 Tax=Actinocorallia sp. A-T 12471 TaxID=3089813 RepID=UPI0029D0544D|nr:HlyD family efflux transporter periplasmic adaptor subunit [Actinocorallia sp. A-T 12471]MDX6741788.1 HlyD family efflux transporter periplasmic adaptor subunit [Actinocorallia sp. A-T 12471]